MLELFILLACGIAVASGMDKESIDRMLHRDDDRME